MSATTETWLIGPDLWSASDQARARAEGWSIACFASAGHSRIRAMLGVFERPFTSNLQAAEYVTERAYQGSEFHQRALTAVMAAILHGVQNQE